mgnify:CR=1 FL=1
MILRTCSRIYFNSNARSTKTRIETCTTFLLLFRVLYSNARSTKTRIETAVDRQERCNTCEIRMQDPLKQGLKHCLRFYPYHSVSYSNARSTKTRIETLDALPVRIRFILFECKIH